MSERDSVANSLNCFEDRSWKLLCG